MNYKIFKKEPTYWPESFGPCHRKHTCYFFKMDCWRAVRCDWHILQLHCHHNRQNLSNTCQTESLIDRGKTANTRKRGAGLGRATSLRPSLSPPSLYFLIFHTMWCMRHRSWKTIFQTTEFIFKLFYFSSLFEIMPVYSISTLMYFRIYNHDNGQTQSIVVRERSLVFLMYKNWCSHMKGGCGVLHWQQSPTDSLTLSISLYHYNISDYRLLYDSILHKHTDQTHRHQITDTRSSTKENKLTCITCQEIEERITIRLKSKTKTAMMQTMPSVLLH